MMALNRGARGWEALIPRINLNPKPDDPVFVAVEEDDPVLDLIPVNGVWMTPEDARKA
jgi:hypothetical protein